MNAIRHFDSSTRSGSGTYTGTAGNTTRTPGDYTGRRSGSRITGHFVSSLDETTGLTAIGSYVDSSLPSTDTPSIRSEYQIAA